MLIPFEGTFTSFFNGKVMNKSQNSRNISFSSFFLADERIRIRTNKLQVRKHTDPDPEHWSVPIRFFFTRANPEPDCLIHHESCNTYLPTISYCNAPKNWHQLNANFEVLRPRLP
jgi:hypothetical protein